MIEEQARVLLPRRDQQWRLRARGVVDDRQRVGQSRRHVQIDDAEPSRGLRVAVRGGGRRRLLERHDVSQARAVERVEERQLGRARIAEEVVDAGGAQDLDEAAGDLHQRGGRGVSIGRPCGTYRASMKLRISPGVFPCSASRITSRVMSMQSVHVAAWLV